MILGVSHQTWDRENLVIVDGVEFCVLKTCQDPSTHIAPKHQDTGKEEQNIKRNHLPSLFHWFDDAQLTQPLEMKENGTRQLLCRSLLQEERL